MKRLWINGERREFEESLTLLEVMEALAIADKVMAAAVNTEIVKQESWARFVPQEGDKIELLHFVGGG